MKKLSVKRILSFVMAACMVLALAPETALSVAAADGVTLTLTAEGSEIPAIQLTEPGGESADAAVQLEAKTLTKYVESFTIQATVTGEETVKYSLDSGSIESGGTPITAEEVTISFGGASSVTLYLCVTAADSPEYYSLTVNNGSKPTPTINVTPAGALTYNGSPQQLIQSVDTNGYDGTVQYAAVTTATEPNDGDWKTSHEDVTAQNAGTYDIYYKATGSATYADVPATKAGTVTIAPATLTVDTPPQAASDLTYNGEAQALVTGGTAPDNGEFQYSEEQTGSYSTTAPTKTDAGTYSVWYKAVATDTNYADSTPVQIPNITIAKATLTVEVTGGTFNFGDSNIQATVTATYGESKTADAGNYTVKYKLHDGSGDELETPASAGTYDVIVELTVDGQKNFTIDGSSDGAKKTFENALTINKTAAVATAAPTSANPTYNGSEQPLVTGGTPNGGHFEYSTTQDGEYSEVVPTGKDATSYTVWYKVVGDENHSDTTPQNIEVKIAPKPVTLTWDDGDLVYDGNSKNVTATLPEGAIVGGDEVTVSVSGGQETNVKSDGSTYTATATLQGTGTENYNLENSMHSYTITPATPTVTVDVDKESPTYGDQVTLTATVNSGSIPSGNFTGTVQFKVDGVDIGTAQTVTGGTATLTIGANDTSLQHALFGETGVNRNITATYSGDTNIAETTSAEKPVTVQKKTLTFTFTPETKTYDETQTVKGTLSEPEGLVSGDTDVQADFTAEAESVNVGTGIKVTVTVTLKGDHAKYYTAKDPTDVTVEIVKAGSSAAQPTGMSDLVYSGSEQGLIQTTGTATGGDMKYYVGEKDNSAQPDGDVAWKDDYTDITGKDAGTYTVWYYVAGDTNHNDTTPQSITVEIGKKEVTLTWKLDEGDTFNITYDGNAHNVTASLAEGQIASGDEENVTVKVTGGQATAAKTEAYTATATIEGERANNYTLKNAEQTYTINSAGSTVTVSAGDTPTYGSDITLTATVDSVGVEEKGNITGTVNFNAGGTPLGAGTPDNNGTWTLTIPGTDRAKQQALFGSGSATQVTAQYAGNGNISGSTGTATVTVTPRTLTYTVTAISRDYDGTTKVEVSLSPDNLVTGDSVTLTATGNLTSANADTYDKVDLTEVSINDDGDAKYYSVAGSESGKSLSGSVTIRPLEVKLEWKLDSDTTFEIDYTGGPHTVTATVTNKKNSDVVEVKVEVKPNTGAGAGPYDATATNAGSYTATATELTGAAKDNYKLPDDPTQAVTIKKIDVTVTAPTTNSLTYTGNPQALVEAGSTEDGTMMYALGDSESSAPGEDAFSANIPTGTDARTYYVWYYVQGDNNHNDSAKTHVTVTIAKAPVSFTVTNNSVDYDTQAHTATVTQNADEVTIPEDGYTVVYTDSESSDSTGGAANKTDAGTYDIWVKLSNDNFKFKNQGDGTREEKLTGKLTIKTVSLTLEVSGSDITYGDALSASTLDGAAKIQGTDIQIEGTWSWDGTPDATHPTVKTDSGTTPYTVKFTPTVNDKKNFVETTLSTTVTITVKKAKLTPAVGTVADIEAFNGETATTGTVTLTGAVLEESPEAEGIFNFVDCTAGESKAVNVTRITLTGSWGDNYELTTTELKNQPTSAKIGKLEVTLEWKLNGGGDFTATYSGRPVSVTAEVTNQVEGHPCEVTVTDGDKTDAGSYTARAALTDPVNYTLPDAGTQAYTIAPAPVSFTVGSEVKEEWEARGETNEDPNPTGYTVAADSTPEVWTDIALTMTYDSYTHTANVAQTSGEATAIAAGETNGFTVTYKRVKDANGDSVTEDPILEIRDAGTYEIWVTLTPTEDGIYNYVFSGQGEARTLKIGEITVEPYAVRVSWSHLNYVYHAHPMHPNVSVLNAFHDDRDDTPTVPAGGPAAYRGTLLAYAVTDGSDVGEYQVTVSLYGTRAGNYTVEDDTETMNIVAAPVTFTVGDNIWDITDDLPDSVTLRAAWGEVATTPDTAVHESYPAAGTRITLSDLAVEIQYRQNEQILDAAPSEAGEYEIWVKIGNGNYRHAATGDGDFHLVGELVLTDDPESIQTHTVVFDPDYEGGVGPAALEGLFANQTVILPAISGRNADGTSYDMTRPGSLFRGWSYGGITYQPNEEFHMPAADVIFKALWLDIENTYSVGGRVMQGSAPVHGADVTLTQGAEDVAEADTDSDGRFSFEYLTPGLYNLVIRYHDGSAEIVKTFLVEITDENVTGEYILPDGALNTVVEVASGITAVAGIESLTAQVDGEIYTAADAATVADGGTVEFRMSIENGTAPADAPEIPVSQDRIGMVLDLGLTKTVTERRGTSNRTEIHDTQNPIPTVIHLPPELQGKTSYTIYRFHEVSDPATGETEIEMHTITTQENADGEYLEVISDGAALVLHARYYSTYVLTWYQDSGEDQGTHRVVLPEATAKGEVTSDRSYALRGSRMILTVKPGKGYDLKTLSVTGRSGGTVAVTDNGDGTYSFIMPAEDVTVNAEFETCPSQAYPDLDVKAWYHPYTDYVITQGLMRGKAPTSFVPDGIVTRAEMVTVLWNMSGTPVVNYLMTYTDVSEEAWYAEAIRWASSEGIVDGYGNNAFGPDDPITREQMATMLYRYEKELGGGGFTGAWMFQSAFTDAAKVNDWAREAVAWCGMNGILEGRGDGSFDPAGKAQRSELAKVLTKYRQISGE